MVINRELEEYGSYCWIQSGNSYSGPLTACVILVSTMCLFASVLLVGRSILVEVSILLHFGLKWLLVS
jgi:hypothetical protein